MKIALIADTHFGCRKNSVYFMEQQRIFYEEKFFPYLKDNDITTIIHLGDFFDNRKTVNFETLRHAKDCFINPITKDGFTLHMIGVIMIHIISLMVISHLPSYYLMTLIVYMYTIQ